MTQLYFDGACEPVNPGGTASYGYWLEKDGKKIAEGSGIVGSGEGMTNNVAEYTGLLGGLKKFREAGIQDKLLIHGDSNLVISMVAKKWGWNRKKTKWVPHDDMPHLKVLLDRTLTLLEGLDYELAWIPRERNAVADRLSKKPLIAAGIISENPEVKPCPVCGQALVKRSGKFGEFYGCKNYPNCTHTEKAS